MLQSEGFAFKLFETTGSDPHLKALKTLAKAEHSSVFKSPQHFFQNETEIYQTLHLPFIPPELREGFGEIERAKSDHFANLIQEKDLKGTFHCHTEDSDGQASLEEMAQAAQNLGWQYLGVADHSKSSYFANGMSEEKILDQIERIRLLNASFPPTFQLFAGVECDILKDGTLDFSDEILNKLDFVVASIHSHFRMEEEEMTKRLIKAIEHPLSTIVGHLTGRILRHRDSYRLNIPKIIDACIANHKVIELNAYPSRLDMDWREWVKAADRGLLCSLNPDAHSTRDLLNCRYGIPFARKGWLEKKDVINTLSLQEMKTFLRKR